MRISVWSHDANPAVDPRLCKQKLNRCEEDVRMGMLRWVNPSDKTMGCVVVRQRQDDDMNEILSYAMRDLATEACLTERVVLANVGIAGDNGEPAPKHVILAAQRKVKAYVETYDDLAPIALCARPTRSRIEITVLQ